MNELRMIENELVPVYETIIGEKVVYGTELYKILEVKSRFNDWVRNRLNDCEAMENEDYNTLTKILVSGGKAVEYIINLDTAKEMAMLERNEKGKQVRKYFIEIEKKYKQHYNETNPTPPLPSDLSPQLQLLINMELKQHEQDQKLNELEDKSRQHTEVLQTVKDTLSNDGIAQNFNKWAVESINAIANSKYFEEYTYQYQKVWGESYKRLTDKAGCNLDLLVKNAKKRAADSGATKAKVKNICKLSVIADNKKLKEIYIAVIKDMVIAYCVEVA